MKSKIKKVAIGLSVIINIIMISTVVWGVSGGAQKLVKDSFIQPYHQRWVSQFDLLEVKPGSTVFLGNSITEAGKWHELFPQSNVINRGIIGDFTTGVIARLDQITKVQPAQVFLLIGTNDLTIGTEQSVIVTNIMTIIETLKKESPQTEVFVQSILPRSAEYQKRIESLNLELESAISGKAKWINLHPLFLDDEKASIDDSLSNDELHLFGRGYIVWRDAINHLVNKNQPVDAAISTAE